MRAIEVRFQHASSFSYLVRKLYMSLAVLLYATLATLAQVPAGPADLLITGAKIRTSDPERPLASAMAVREGVIVAIGEEKDVLRWEGMGTKRIALAGKTI